MALSLEISRRAVGNERSSGWRVYRLYHFLWILLDGHHKRLDVKQTLKYSLCLVYRKPLCLLARGERGREKTCAHCQQSSLSARRDQEENIEHELSI